MVAKSENTARRKGGTAMRSFTIGLIAALCILARLDLAPVVMVLILVIRGFKRGILACGLVLLLCLPYAFWIHHYTGHLLPVSAHVKSQMDCPYSWRTAAYNFAYSNSYYVLPVSKPLVKAAAEHGVKLGRLLIPLAAGCFGIAIYHGKRS